MTGRAPPSSERELFASMLECARQGVEIRRRERRVNRRLARLNLRLERSRAGYAIPQAITQETELDGKKHRHQVASSRGGCRHDNRRNRKD